MASVHLTPAELQGDEPLPPCCVVCGKGKAKLVQTAFAVNAGQKWSMMSGSVSVMRYLTTHIPLCSEHKTYFTSKQYRMLYIFGGVFAAFVVLIAISAIAAMVLGSNATYVIAPAALLAVFSLFGVVAYMFKMTKTGVHPSSIKRDGMQLENVSRKFADALEDLRDEIGDVDPGEFEEFSDDGASRRSRPRKASKRTSAKRSRRRDDDDDDDFDDDDYDDRPPKRRRSRR